MSFRHVVKFWLNRRALNSRKVSRDLVKEMSFVVLNQYGHG